jgi:CO/xanthine dehydrogenase Mo-binding subunit
MGLLPLKGLFMNEIKKPFKWVGTAPVRPDGVPKVTGTAKYGNDYTLPGALYGKVLRSPHAHARIKSIDTSKAEALKGVKAVVTSKDFPEQNFAYIGPERVAVNFWHVTRNIMAREKTLYEGHAVAAVAATDAATAAKACKLIEIDYEVLPHVIDVDEAMAEDAPLLFEDMKTRGVEPEPAKASNVSKKLEFSLGDTEAGFKEADEIVEKEFKTAAVHQGYIEPHACLAKYDPDGQGEIWSSSQGHFVVRGLTSKLLGMKLGDLKVNPASAARRLFTSSPSRWRCRRSPAIRSVSRCRVTRCSRPQARPPALPCGSRSASRRTARWSPPRASSSSRRAPSRAPR